MAEAAISVPQIGPESHGMRMTLDDFARVEGQPGYIFELEKGVIVVVDVPGVPHAYIKQVVRDALVQYRLSHPQRVSLIAETSDSALRMPEMQSERHPDISVYLTAPPTEEAQPWEYWIPEIAVEIVSESSAHRDYHIKPDEYLKAGVRLYWIIDPRDQTATVLTRRGDKWREQKLDSTGALRTSMLPGFDLKLADVFAAAR
ncbi:MAG: Uma2 family endonuclease [Planctomycetes bacterium]|nr:Uma2 family endonuclease [Planctomycetota bacterium]